MSCDQARKRGLSILQGDLRENESLVLAGSFKKVVQAGHVTTRGSKCYIGFNKILQNRPVTIVSTPGL